MFGESTRRLVALLVVGSCVLGAGCVSLGTSEEDLSSTVTESTPTATSTEEPEGYSHDDGHSHGTDEATETATDGGEGTSTATGKLTVVADSRELDLQSRDEDGDGLGIASDPHTWVSSESSLTLLEALARFGVDAQSDTLTVDGETHREATDGTTLSYRVNGDPVDPETYRLEDGDEVWVVAETAETNVSVPGTYIDNEQQHVHGEMTVTVDGEQVDFGRTRYQSNDRYFHFEDGDGSLWHAHSWSLSLEYALSSLDGISASQGSLTYNGTMYDESDSGTSITVEANGESVAVDEYYLKDGDDIRINIERTET